MSIRASAQLSTPESTNLPSHTIKALSFFSGAMGLDIGLEQEGIHVVLASEIDKDARLTIQTNKPDCPLIGDILNYTANEILENAGLSSFEDVDLIVGGPPCQAFSTAGKRSSFKDERGNVFLTFIDLITQIRPKYAVIENVRGLLSASLVHRPHNLRGKGHPSLTEEEQPGGALRYIIRILESAGYGISFNLYNSANFGTPEIRERMVIVCSRIGEELPYLEPTHAKNGEYGLQPWVTFRDAVTSLSGQQHQYVKFPEKRLKYYRLLGPGQNWRNLPSELQKEALGKAYDSGGGKTGFLRRIAWDAPCPTLVTHPAMPATDLAHPELDRPLSVEEYKKVQEFPDDWVITGNIQAQYRQIGNAVPISLGRAIGRLIKRHINNEPIKQYDGFVYSRYIGCDHHTWKRENQKDLQPKQLELAI
ncbi:MAG: DNA cytosine methyltransferase [Cyanomargarita calcarea GSE-NOS-MK-12-04C]|jgi:DNA (cytosine-5)-methyltransferase 1|uniref:Cytosine-specific methyltransferase n=1 Tax=Cyanomargarita calcarea GSE-NOS-MK-12-04C TaxID=2839659 RepID=A0A951QMM8_9CYAN|nr:DNA cytosine methyltransferase [Cyanomargarita calcarea GSE-NOS-MK-12-04C]